MSRSLSVSTRDGGSRALAPGELDSLERALAGTLLGPGDPAYEGARHVWNGLIDKHPGLIVRCAGEDDVVAAVRFARDRDLEVAVRGGGHNVAGRAVSEGGLVVDLTPMRRVEPAGGRAVVQGGATLGDVDAATLPRGRVVPLGVVPATGVAGLTLHGGYGWLSRRFGLTIDNLIAARVVTADGAVARASADEDPDLLWALKGGGGNFGVVTSFEFETHPLEPAVTLGVFFFPLDRAARALRGFREAMRSAPETLGSVAFLWSTPPFPEVPAARHGEPALAFVAVWSGPPGDAAAALRPLREADRPMAVISRRVPFGEAQRLFADQFPEGRRYYWKSLYLPALDDDAIGALVEATERRPSPLSFLDIWALGGAIARVPDDATAFANRRKPVLIGLESNWEEPDRTADNIAFTRAIHARLARGTAATPYLNFPGFGEGGEGFVRAAYGANYERLRRLKARYDPDNLFRGNFNLAPAGAAHEPAAPGP